MNCALSCNEMCYTKGNVAAQCGRPEGAYMPPADARKVWEVK